MIKLNVSAEMRGPPDMSPLTTLLSIVCIGLIAVYPALGLLAVLDALDGEGW